MLGNKIGDFLTGRTNTVDFCICIFWGSWMRKTNKHKNEKQPKVLKVKRLDANGHYKNLVCPTDLANPHLLTRTHIRTYFFRSCFPVNARCANRKQNYNLCLIGRRSVFVKVLILTSTHLTNYFFYSIKKGDTTSELQCNDTVFKIKLLLMDTVTLEITCRHSSYACIYSAAVIPLTPVGLDRNYALLL